MGLGVPGGEREAPAPSDGGVTGAILVSAARIGCKSRDLERCTDCSSVRGTGWPRISCSTTGGVRHDTARHDANRRGSANLLRRRLLVQFHHRSRPRWARHLRLRPPELCNDAAAGDVPLIAQARSSLPSAPERCRDPPPLARRPGHPRPAGRQYRPCARVPGSAHQLPHQPPLAPLTHHLPVPLLHVAHEAAKRAPWLPRCRPRTRLIQPTRPAAFLGRRRTPASSRSTNSPASLAVSPRCERSHATSVPASLASRPAPAPPATDDPSP